MIKYIHTYANGKLVKVETIEVPDAPADTVTVLETEVAALKTRLASLEARALLSLD